MMLTNMGAEQMDFDLQGLFEKGNAPQYVATRNDGGRSPQCFI